MKYCSKIVGWGDEALYFLEDPEMNFIILFNEGAPPELQEISVLHTQASLMAEPAVGDTMLICDKVFTITAIGDEALHTLKELGHCTICFKGGQTPERPGCIMVEGDDIAAADIVKDGCIEIY